MQTSLPSRDPYIALTYNSSHIVYSAYIMDTAYLTLLIVHNNIYIIIITVYTSRYTYYVGMYVNEYLYRVSKTLKRKKRIRSGTSSKGRADKRKTTSKFMPVPQ